MEQVSDNISRVAKHQFKYRLMPAFMISSGYLIPFTLFLLIIIFTVKHG